MLGREISLGGWERWDTLHIASRYHGSHTIPAYMGQLLFLGGPQPAGRCTGWSALHGGYAGVLVMKREAQEGGLPWVGASQHPKVHKDVTVDGKVCAELLRMYGENYTTIG